MMFSLIEQLTRCTGEEYDYARSEIKRGIPAKVKAWVSKKSERFTSEQAAKALGISHDDAGKALRRLEQEGAVKKLVAERGKAFVWQKSV